MLKQAIMHIAEDKIHCISGFFFNIIFVNVNKQLLKVVPKNQKNS